MLKFETIIVCKQQIDHDDGRTDLNEIIRNIKVVAVPDDLPRVVVSAWGIADPGTYEASLLVEIPGEKQLHIYGLIIDPNDEGVFTVVVELQDMPLQRVGEYKFTLLSGGQSCSTSFYVSEQAIKENFTASEIDTILSDDNLRFYGRRSGNCPKCGTTHTFIKSLKPDFVVEETDIPLPDTLKYMCSHCKDFEFDLRVPYRRIMAEIGKPKLPPESAPRKDEENEKASSTIVRAAKEAAAGDERKNG